MSRSYANGSLGPAQGHHADPVRSICLLAAVLAAAYLAALVGVGPADAKDPPRGDGGPIVVRPSTLQQLARAALIPDAASRRQISRGRELRAELAALRRELSGLGSRPSQKGKERAKAHRDGVRRQMAEWTEASAAGRPPHPLSGSRRAGAVSIPPDLSRKLDELLRAVDGALVTPGGQSARVREALEQLDDALAESGRSYGAQFKWVVEYGAGGAR